MALGRSQGVPLAHTCSALPGSCLQGEHTPRLMYAGLSADGRFRLLLASRVFGRPLEEGDAHLLPSALAALREVHAKGLCHGDVRLPNFIVTSQDDGRDCQRVGHRHIC